MKNYNLIINSTIFFVTASIIEVTFHESAHFITAILLSAQNISLHHCYVQYETDQLSLVSKIWIAASGPLLSLAIGLIFHYVTAQLKGKGFIRLFCTYLSAFGYIGFFGYMMTSPFFSYGDTGFVMANLGIPMWLIVVISIFTTIIFYIIMSKLSKYFIAVMSPDTTNNKELRDAFISYLILYPTIIGIFIFTLLNLPVPTFLSLIAPICSPFALLWPFRHYLRDTIPIEELDPNEEITKRIQWYWILLLLLVVICNRLLVGGLAWN